MARHLFIAQQTLSAWLEQDKVAFNQNRMTIKADGRSFNLVEAVRFIKVEGEGEDAPGLLGKVKTLDQLKAMGAERYCDSVIFRDVAYKVQEGFVGEVLLRREEIPSPAKQPAVKTPAQQACEPHSADVTRTQPNLSVVEAAPSTWNPVPGSPAAAGPEKKEGEPTDEELLTQFLLKNL